MEKEGNSAGEYDIPLSVQSLLEPLPIDFERRIGIENVAAYADDIAFLGKATQVYRTLAEITPLAEEASKLTARSQ